MVLCHMGASAMAKSQATTVCTETATARMMQAISFMPGDDVQVEMEHVLPGRAARGMKQVHRLSADCSPVMQDQLPGNHGNPRELLVRQVIDVDEVGLGNDQRVADTDGIDVQKRQHRVILVDSAGRRGSGDNPAERTVRDGPHEQSVTIPGAKSSDESLDNRNGLSYYFCG